jgi:ABC-type branched-subunit amino acid transport system substrate-binding protein
MRTVRTVAFVLLLGLVASACGARLAPQLRKQAASAALSAGGGGAAAGSGLPGAPTDTSSAGPAAAVNGGTAGTAGTAGTSGTSGSKTQGGTTSSSGGCAGGATDVGMTSNQVVFGNVSSTTGPVSGLFEGAVQGAQAWAAYANSLGGICGHSVKINFSDDGTNCQNNQNSTEELAKKVFAFVGSFSLYDGCGANYFAAHHEVPDIHVALQPAADTPPNHFDVETGGLGYATGMFAYYAQKFGDKVKHVGTLYANVGGAVPKQKSIVNAAEHEGWKFVYSRGADATESDWTSDFVKMCREDNIDIFFTDATNANYAAKMIQDEDQAGCKKDLINIIPIAYDQAFIQDAQGSPRLEGLLGWNEYALFFNSDEAQRIPELQQLQGWFARTYPGKPLNLYALFAWASGRLVQETMQKLGSKATRATLMAALHNIHSYTANGIVAPVDPNDKRGGVKCYVLWQLHNGKFARVDDPATGYRCDGQFLPYNG